MKRLEAIELPAEEIAHQKALMHEFALLEQRPRTYCVVTYGCQMNAHDSEKLEGMLAEMGLEMRDLTRDLHNSPLNEGNVMTEYEKNFSEKGFPIHAVTVIF